MHGLAGDLGAQDKGELSLTAEDLLERVPAAFQVFMTSGQGADAAEVAAAARSGGGGR
jgi:hypothetical protein